MAAVRAPWWLWLDVAVVFVFVIAGRRTHDEAETISGVIRTAAPFVLGLLAGWTVTRAWHRPASGSVGLGVLAATVVVGMALRRFVFGEGIAWSFIAVATLFLALGLLGWRLIAARVMRSAPESAGDDPGAS